MTAATPSAAQIADELTTHERDLLLGTATGWGSWMWEAGEYLCSKGLGTRGQGYIQFDTPLAREVRDILNAKALGNGSGQSGSVVQKVKPNLAHYVAAYEAAIAADIKAKAECDAAEQAHNEAEDRFMGAREAVSQAGTALLEYIEASRGEQ